MTKYEIILYWSNEDQAFIAEVPELAGCAADGLTRQEALANAETVITEWIETARELGRPSRNVYLASKRSSQPRSPALKSGVTKCTTSTSNSATEATTWPGRAFRWTQSCTPSIVDSPPSKFWKTILSWAP